MGKMRVGAVGGSRKVLVPIIIAISVVIVLVGGIVGAILLLKPTPKTHSGKLSTPENLMVQRTETGNGYQYFVRYDEVDGADRYIVYINDEFSHSSTSTVVDITKYITEAKTYNISVQAINNRISSYNSEKVSVDYQNRLKLQTPQVTRTNEVFLWSAISNAMAYNVEFSYGNIRNEEQIEGSTYDFTRFLNLTQNDPTITDFTFRVQAVYLGNLLWENSDFSETAEYHVVKNLEDVYLTHYIENTTINNRPVTRHKISWSSCYGADNYEVYLSHNGGAFELVQTVDANNFVFDLTNFLSGVGTYVARVKATSNNEYVLSSLSNDIDFVVSQKIATPTNVQAVPSGEYISVSWEPGDDKNLQTYYSIIVSNETTVVHDAIVVGTNYDFLLVVNRQGFYSISIIAKNQNQSNLYTDSDPSTPVEITVSPKLNAPSNISFRQDEPNSASSLSWSRVDNATGYAIQLYVLDVDQKVEYGSVLYSSNTSISLPFNTAGFYFAKVKALVDGGFFKDSDYSDFVDCTFRTVLETPQNLALNEPTLVLSWTVVENAFAYGVSINDEMVTGVSYDTSGTTISVTNLAEILSDANKYPSNESMPYVISVKALGEQNGVYADSAAASIEHFVTRQLNAPTNLSYAQTPDTNDAFLSWDAVEHATNGYRIYINDNVPASLQMVTGTGCNIGQYLLPGRNKIQIMANRSPNYSASELASFDENPEFYYYMQPVQNVNVLADTQNGNTTYSIAFETHQYANYFVFSFYSDEQLTQKIGADHIESVYYTNNDVVSFAVDYDCIKRTGDCITYIKVVTAYEAGFEGSLAANFDANYIIGDGVTALYSKSATSVLSYENETLLLPVSNERVESYTNTSFTMSFEYLTATINMGKVRSFELTLITVDAVNGNSYAVPVTIQTSEKVASPNIGYSKYFYTFSDVGIGQYQVRIRALSNNTAKVANSTYVYLSYKKTITQATPQNLTIFRSTEASAYGNVIMQWDAIESVSNQLPTTYDASLYFFDTATGESTLIQTWTDIGYNNLVITRSGQIVRIIRINLSLARYTGNQNKVVEEFMQSGLYYMTVKANALSEYYLESALATMPRANYYQHDAMLTPPTIYLTQNGELFVPYVESVYYQICYNTDADANYVAMENLSCSLSIYNDGVNNIKSLKYNIKAYFESGFEAGQYHIVAYAKRDIEVNSVVSTVTSLPSNVVNYSVINNFNKPNNINTKFEYIYNQAQSGYISKLTFVIDLVTANSGTVVATDYEVFMQKGSFNRTFVAYSLDGTDNYAIKVLENNVWTTYNFVSKTNGICTFNYNSKLGFTTQIVENGSKLKFELYNLDYLTNESTYACNIRALGNEEAFFGDSPYEYTSFTYKQMWEAPTIAFVDEYNQDIAAKYIETNDGAGVSLHIDPLVGTNTATVVDWCFNVIITNLSTGEVEKTLGPVTGVNVAGVTGRIYTISPTNFKNGGLYKIEAKIVNTKKYDSPTSNSIYVYNSVNNTSPRITKVAKASTFYGATDINDIAMEWAYTGFANVSAANLSFTVTVTETNEDGSVVVGGYSDSVTILANTLTCENGIYSATVLISSFANPNAYFWSKNWGPSETVTHYTFAVIANAYSTSLTSVYANLVADGETESAITPSASTKYTPSGKLYQFNENSVPVGYVIRRDSALNAPTGFNLVVNGDTKSINWEAVSDTTGSDYAVGYKYVYYTVTSAGQYYLHTNNGADPVRIKFNNATVLNYSDDSEITFLTNKNNFWFSTTQNTFTVEANVATVFGVWMFSEPLNPASISSASTVSFNMVSYTQPILLPEQLLWETTTDNSLNAIYFENPASAQFASPTVNLYKQIYSITLGGHTIDWVADASSLGAITASDEEFRVVVSGLYNAAAFTENTDETGVTINRQYSFIILANDYFITAFDPTNATYQASILLYEANGVEGIVYKPIVVKRSVDDADITLENSFYFAEWEENSSATKYELIFVDASNHPLGLDTRYFANNTVPENYVEKLSVNVVDGICTYTESGVLNTVQIQISNDALRKIKVDFTPLLNGRPATTYYLSIYTVADNERYITPNGVATLSTKSFNYLKQYQAVDEDSILFTTDEEGLLKTISWAENPNPDGGWVHDSAYYRFTIWDTNHDDPNPVLYQLDGSGHRFACLSISELSGVSSLDNLIGSPVFTFENSETLGPRMVLNVEQLFKTYLRKDGVRNAGAYTIGIQILPVNAGVSSYQASLSTTKDFVYKVKLELDENTNYVSFMIDSCLNSATTQSTHEIVFKDVEAQTKAQEYLDRAIIANNFNLKSVYVDSWLPETQSVALDIYMRVDSKWVLCGQIVDVLSAPTLLLSGGQFSLVAGENQLAIKALGVNENYLASELKVITFTLFYKHPTPTVSIDEENTQYTDNEQTLSHIFLKLSGVATQNYDVVIKAYRVIDNTNVLAFTTPTDANNRIVWLGEEGRFAYKSTYEIEEKRNMTVNFMDFFRANAGVIYGNSEYDNYLLYSLIGAYDYVFTARIYASPTETYMINSDESAATSTLSYTYKLQTPSLATTTNEDDETVQEFITRDADEQITSVKIKIKLDNPGFKTIIDYSVNVWDLTAQDSRYILNNNDTMRYTAKVLVDFSVANGLSYTIKSVTYAAYSQAAQAVASANYANYFTIDENGYLVFELMNFIKSDGRINNYLAGKYRYNVRADMASNYYTEASHYELNRNAHIFTSEYAYDTEIEADEAPYTTYFEYTHTIPYPVAITSAVVDEHGVLSIVWKDTYQTAMGFDVLVNDVSTTLLLEQVNPNDQQTYLRNISNLLVPGRPNVVKVNVQEIGYYQKGKQITATLDFVTWTHEIVTIKNLSWAEVSGTQALSFDTEFCEIYIEDDRLVLNEVNAGRVHFSFEILYLSNFNVDSVSGLNEAEIFEVFKAADGVERLYIPDLSALGYAQFIAQIRGSYNFDLNKCIKSVNAEWIVNGSLRGGYYAVKLTGTVANLDGTYEVGTECFLDGKAYIPYKYVLSPWQLSGNISLWDNMDGAATKSTQTATEQKKAIWADNEQDDWGVSFAVTEIKGTLPSEYKVYYFRDDSETAFDETYSFVVRGTNVVYESGAVWLNFRPYFNKTTVKYAGIYSFAIKALATQDIASESVYIGMLSTQGVEIVDGAIENYTAFGLKHFVRLNVPVLDDTLYDQRTQQATIKISTGLTIIENEDNLVENYVLTNFRSTTLVDGQEYPSNLESVGSAEFTGDTLVYHERTNPSLALQYGENFISAQSTPVGDLAEYYLSSAHSNLKCYNWEVTLQRPTEFGVTASNFTDGYQDYWVGQQLKKVPENMDISVNGNQNGMHSDTNSSAYGNNIGGVRSQGDEFDEQNNVTYQNYLTISATVSAAATVIDGITRIELRVFDPVTNANGDDTRAIAYFLIKIDLATEMCYFEKMAIIGTNAENEGLVDMRNAVIGSCHQENDDVRIVITGLKIYQIFPKVTYASIPVRADKNDPTAITTFTGVKDFSNIPQKYIFKINSVSAGVNSLPETFEYDYSLRLLTPEIAENGIEFTGEAIATLGGEVYIKDNKTANKIINTTTNESKNVDDYVISVVVNKISRNTNWIKLYVYVDDTGIKDYYINEESEYFANYLPTYSNFNTKYKYCYKFVDVSSIVQFENENALYGTAEIQITQTDAIWHFINQNTPNVFAFHVQAVTQNGDFEEFVEHEGDLYLFTRDNQNVVDNMVLRYSESYISAKQTFTLKRQFAAAPIDLRFDFGQVGEDDITLSLVDQVQTKTVAGNTTNLHLTSGVALDPYLIVNENSYASTLSYKEGSARPHASSLSYEYSETQKYGAYEVKITCGSKTSEVKTFTTIVANDGSTSLGLFETVEKFDAIAAENPARYYFENNTYKNKSILSSYCLYDLFASACNTSTKQGGVCTIAVRAITSENTKWRVGNDVVTLKPNLWVSQDDAKWTLKTVDFYTRPDAVKLTLGNAVFDENNPLCVRWGTETNENELLYPNNIPLSWTASSSNYGSYTIDITRSSETEQDYQGVGFKYTKNQGTNNFAGTSVNIANPNFSNSNNSGYDNDQNSYARFNYWDWLNGGNSTRIEGNVVPYYNIVVQPNGNMDNHVGKGYRSGANDDGILNDVTNYFMQLKYNIGSFVATSTIKSSTRQTATDEPNDDGNLNVYEVSNLSSLVMTTQNKSGQTATISLTDEAGNAKNYGFVGRTYVTLSGPFTFTRNNEGEYVASEKTIDLQATESGDWNEAVGYIKGYSVQGLKKYILDFLEHIDAVGGKYNFQIMFSSGDPNQPQDNEQHTLPFIKSEASGIYEFEYYRLVEDSGLSIVDLETIEINEPAALNAPEDLQDNEEEQEDEEEQTSTPTYGVQFKPTKNLSEYEKFVGEYSIVMEQVNASTKTAVLSNEVAHIVSYNTIGYMGTEEQGAALRTAVANQAFNSSTSDALTSATIQESDATKFVENGYTYNIGSLQGGKNTYVYTITAGDNKYNLPFKKRVRFTYSIPSTYMPSIPTAIDYQKNTEEGQTLILNDYYEVQAEYDSTFTQPRFDLAYGANYDLYYTLHSKTLTGFTTKASISYKNAYSYSYEFKYDKLTIGSKKATVYQYTGEQVEYEYNFYKKESTEIKKTTQKAESKNGQDFKIVIDEKKDPLCSDKEDANTFNVEFSKLGKEIKVIKVSEFKFSATCLPGFASVFKTDTNHQWDSGNAGTVSKTYNSGVDAEKAKLGNAQKTKVKYATANVQHVFQYGSNKTSIWTTGWYYTIDIGKKSEMKLYSYFSTRVRYFNLPFKAITFGDLKVGQTIRHQNEWTHEHTDWWGLGGSDTSTEKKTENQTVGPINAELGFSIGLKEKVNKNNRVELCNLRLRPENDSGGIFDSWSDKYYDEKTKIDVNNRSVSCTNIIVGDFLVAEDEGVYNPYRHDRAGLQQYLFGETALFEEQEREPCQHCNGTTYETSCSTCHGSGLVAGGEGFCSTCLGTGKEPCHVCNSNWCQGYELECSVCGGNKQLLCKRCSGQGYLKFDRSFTKYVDANGEEQEIPKYVNRKNEYKNYFTTTHTYEVGCPDCGGSGVYYDDWDSLHTNSTFNKVYYDVNTGTLKQGSTEISRNDRKTEITVGTGHVDCYVCSHGSQQGSYDEYGVPTSSTPAPINCAETAELVYTPCLDCDKNCSHCGSGACEDCDTKDANSNTQIEKQPQIENEQRQNPLSKNVVDNQIETNGQQPQQNDTPLQYAESITSYVKTKQDDEFVAVDIPICLDTVY